MTTEESITPGALSDLISVIIVSYNGAHYLRSCLDSVLDQDFPRDRYQVVVIDNASHDGSADLVEQNYPSVRVVRLDRNYGPNAAQLMVVPSLRTRYIAYLNQDTIVHRRWLAELVGVMSSNPGTAMVESNMILPGWPEYGGLRREGLVERAYVVDVSSWGTEEVRTVPVSATTPPIPVLALYGAAALSDLTVLAKLDHVLDPDFFCYADDLDLGLRLNARGFRILFAPRSVIYHDTEWHIETNLRSMKRALWCTENGIIAFYKVCYWDEFLLILPRILLGKLIKAGQNHASPVMKLVMALLGTPLLLFGLVRALFRLPRYSERRRRTLAERKMPRGWTVDRLMNSGWKPDPAVWAQRSRTA